MRTFARSSRMKSLLCLTFPLIGACSSADSMTGDYGADTFTLIANSPANFELTFKSQYSPESGQNCDVYVPGLGSTQPRRHQKTDSVDVKDRAQTTRFKIPLSYHIAGCTLALTRVAVAIDGRYGPSSLDIGGDVGGISVRGGTASGGVTPSAPGTAEFRGLCTWMFQLSVARIEDDGISKILSCSAADSNWNVPADYYERGKPGGTVQRSTLKNSEISFTYRLSEDEVPSMDNRWIKTTQGWKPCQGSATSERCQKPPVFKKFKINGRECSVYPNCTE
ncbi:hypothetical protein [Pseudomonas sp. SM4]|uniref:hypothetical protein n=1 Tax=Pseudomonas sp. SM4 TaxID=3424177 RepID=UPI003F7A9261